MTFLFKIDDIFDLFRWLHIYLRDVIRWFLENTLFKANPSLSEQFADPIILLCSLTAILLMLELVTKAKKLLAAITVLGWIILIIGIIVKIA
ncbi:MAG: hypothetical protein QXR45_16455 [Candidatus Bathyarchaeia archaeon]